jgi:spore coat polysaccharide biosynthesis predicted glycosyltransferase SpsG
VTRPQILFRGDASHALGYGHVARLCALIEELEPDVEARGLFGGAAGEDGAVAAWTAHHQVPAEIKPWTTGEVLTAASHSRVRAVVIDGPALAAELVPELACRGVRTVLIDDRGSALPADVVINHNFHAPALASTYPCARRRLLGRKYLLLRKTIRRYPRGACKPRDGARLRVVVTFGGSDPVGATARTVRLLPADPPLDVVVVAGPGYRDHAALSAATATAVAAGHTVEVVRDPDDPGAVFVGADAAICSAGGTLGELAYLGCPALAYAIVGDQVICARTQIRSGLISGGRTWLETSDEVLASDLAAFLADGQRRHHQRHRALATADALGPHRILTEALSGG